jgi:electron transport complex protein RnfE
MTKLSIVTKGIIKENPVLVLLLGLCPALAVSTEAVNAIGMGVATTFVLLGSNVAISLLRKIIPDKVRIPCYIVLIAGFVTLAQMTLEAFDYEVYQALGIFLPLIAVNCIIFARAEVFANRNRVSDSALDAIGMGLGFTLALFIIASLREIFGNGTWMGFALPVLATENIPIFTMAPGGFAVFGLLIALINKISKGKAIKKKEIGCTGCPSFSSCKKAVHS